jgi:hypothetical protein
LLHCWYFHHRCRCDRCFLPTTWNYRLVLALCVFPLVQITRYLCLNQAGCCRSHGFCQIALLYHSSSQSGMFLNNNMEFQAGSSFASLFGSPYYKACTQWNWIYQVGAVDHMDLSCCMAILLVSLQAHEAFLTKQYMELQAGSSFTSLWCGP